jgi:hypothetical protein
LLALLDALPEDSPFLQLDPPQRRQRTLAALKRVLLRESQAQPLVLVFEDLHWIDAETQALVDSLVESLPTAQLLLLVNYRPEYQHGWGSKTYYTQLRLDPLPPTRAAEVLQALHQLGVVQAHADPPDTTQAEAHYQQALALADELGMRPLMAHCHHGLGQLYATIGCRAEACAELSTAIELYRAMEMTFWLPQAEAALAQVEGR